MRKPAPHPELSAAFDLQIADVAYGGRGIGRHGGKVCFVRGALPGETVQVRIQRDFKSYVEARLIAIQTPSPQRIEPVCPLVAAGCPGCFYQHAVYKEELEIKQRQFADLLSRQAGLDPAVLVQPIGAPAEYGYRNKIVLHASSASGQRVFGYVLEDNETVVDVERCPLAAEPINALLRELRQKPGFLGGLREGTSVTLRHTAHDGAVYWSGQAGARETWLREDTRLGQVSVPRGSFFQVNPSVADALIAEVMTRLEHSPAPHVGDLYCGVGLFGLAAVQAGKKQVVGIDSDTQAVKAAEYNLRNASAALTWLAQDAEEALPAARRHTAASETILILDPPRRGLHRNVLNAVLAAKPAEVLYVSCAANTLARDLAAMASGGYAIDSAQLIDMFPRTPHFESVTHLCLK